MQQPTDRKHRHYILAGIAVAGIGLVYVVAFLWPQIDYRLLEGLARLRTPALEELAFSLTRFGGFSWLFPATIVLVAIVAFKSRALAAFTILMMSTTAVATRSIKTLTARDRPGEEWALADVAGYSFPSGHATSALTFGLVIALVIRHFLPDLSRGPLGKTVLAMPILFGLAIGLTRPYIGVHFPTDVVAGWALAIGTCALFWAILPKEDS